MPRIFCLSQSKRNKWRPWKCNRNKGWDSSVFLNKMKTYINIFSWLTKTIERFSLQRMKGY